MMAVEAQSGRQMDVIEDIEYGGKEVGSTPALSPDLIGPSPS